jgi:hypothetical protein
MNNRRHQILRAICLLLPLLPAGVVWGQSADSRPARLRDGEPFAAPLVEIDDQWGIRFGTGEQQRVVAAEDLVWWGEVRDSDRTSQIVLADGSWLIGDVLQIDSSELRIYSSFWGELALPRATVRGILFNPSPAPLARDLARGQLIAEGGEDRLLLENGDVITGTVRGMASAEGVIDHDATRLAFSTQGRQVNLPLETITAVVFDPSRLAQAAAQPRVLFGLRDGSRLFVQRVETQGPLRRLVLADQVHLETDPASLWSEVTGLQPLGMGVTYVSDLELVGYRHIPLLEQTRPLGRDRNLQGGLLRSGGRLYAKGLSMPTASRVACSLQGAYRRFEAELALDDLAGRHGSVVFRVFLSDGAGGWRSAYESPPIRGGDPPAEIAIDVTGVHAMALIAEMGQWGDVLDHASWLNARLID